MAQWLKIHSACAEDVGSIPSAHIRRRLTPAPGDLLPSFMHTYPPLSHSQIIKNKLNLKKKEEEEVK